MKKKRKQRGVGLDGKPSLDLCPRCFSFYCNPQFMSDAFYWKCKRRLEAGQCVACGHVECVCRSCK